MIKGNVRIGIIGLGLLGGSYAMGLSEAGYTVKGIDTDPDAVSYAKQMDWIKEGGDDVSILSDCGIVISALYPHAFVQWVRDHQNALMSGTILTDVTGVKREVIKRINEILRDDVEFIACHPMAGREFRGIRYADSSLFQSANYIIVPGEETSERAMNTAKDLAEILRFQRITVLSAEEHDRMIGFLSQLTHVIAVSLMNVSDNSDLASCTGDSFRDLTRIANINDALWPELFVMNKDYLIREIDAFVNEMNTFRDLIAAEDEGGMQEKMRISTLRRKAFDKV